MRIHPQVEMISSMVSNQYLLIEPGSLTLIDTGLRNNDRKILGTVIRLGYSPKQISRILITHADGDHYGSAAALKRVTGAQFCSSPLEAQAMAKGESSREMQPANGLQRFLFRLTRSMFRSPSISMDQVVKEGEILPVIGGLQVLETPGHTPGHLSFFLTAEAILFAGDSIRIKNGSPAPSIGANTWDLELARKSFERQMVLNPKMILAGHGTWISPKS